MLFRVLYTHCQQKKQSIEPIRSGGAMSLINNYHRQHNEQPSPHNERLSVHNEQLSPHNERIPCLMNNYRCGGGGGGTPMLDLTVMLVVTFRG